MTHLLTRLTTAGPSCTSHPSDKRYWASSAHGGAYALHSHRRSPVRSWESAFYAYVVTFPLSPRSAMLRPSLDTADPHDATDQAINQDRLIGDSPQHDAIETGTTLPPGRDTTRDRHTEGVETGAAAVDPPLDSGALVELCALQSRDRGIVDQTVLLRLLSYDQVQRLTFDGLHRTAMRRRLRALARSGWLTLWDGPAPRGGRCRFVLPTARAIHAVFADVKDRTTDAPHARLVARMVPRRGRRALDLEQGAAPKWLGHQLEVNHLLVGIQRSDRRVLWASSWDCPLPSRIGMFTLPQPDYVLVEEVAGVPRLVFGEHDRASEPVERFIERKVALYTTLADFPEFCAETFGVSSFEVHVTVVDPVRHAPIERVEALLAAVERGGATDRFRFTLGGWLFDDPVSPVWFTVDAPPRSTSVRRQDHQTGLA